MRNVFIILFDPSINKSETFSEQFQFYQKRALLSLVCKYKIQKNQNNGKTSFLLILTRHQFITQFHNVN